MSERTKTRGQGRWRGAAGGSLAPVALWREKDYSKSPQRPCFERTVIPARAVKGDANTSQDSAAAPAAPGISAAFRVPLNRLHLGTIKL